MADHADKVVQTEAIARLVEKGRSDGREDAYVGKRRWRRYHLGMPLEVTLDPQVCGGSWRVITHNISGGGIGFWSAHAFTHGDRIFVREYSEQGSGVWLAGRVVYSVLGLNGYLTGVAFDNPTEPDFIGVSSSTAMARSAPSRRHGSCQLPISLEMYVAALCAGAGLLAGAVAETLAWYAGAELPSLRLMIAQLAAVLLTGGLLGWLAVHDEAHAIRMIREAVTRLGAGTPNTRPLPPALTTDVAAIRQAILDLGFRWREYVEAERSQRQKLEEINQIKSNVLSVVSHDLRTPLTSIQLYSEMLAEDLDNLSKEDQRSFLNTISEECLKLTRLVSDLIEVQRSESDRVAWVMEPVDPVRVIESVAKTFAPIAAQQDIRLLVECPDTLPQVRGNADKLTQAVSNLVSNALKYSDAGTTVRLVAESYKDEIQIHVADEGPGIHRDKWDVIFERFVQVHPDGSGSRGVGLGLYIVRQIAERHGGCVWVDSEPGQGSEFTLALPTAERFELKADEEADEVAGRILVCDADPSTAARLGQVLRQGGFEVRLAHSGNRLLEQLEEAGPDVVITDTVLPDMQSEVLLGRLAAMKPWPFRLVLHSMGTVDESLRSFGVDVFLERPVTRDELILAAQVAMHKRRGAGPVALLVRSHGVDMDVLARRLSAEGGFPIVVSDASAAAAYLHTHPVDFVFIGTGPEGVYAKTVRAVHAEAYPETRVYALSDALTDRECERHSKDNLVYIRFVPGREESLVSTLMALCREERMERVE